MMCKSLLAIGLILLVSVIIPALAGAADIEKVNAPDNIWLTEYTETFSYRCINSTNLTELDSILISKGGWSSILDVSLGNTTYTATWDVQNINMGVGTYEMEFRCNESGTISQITHYATVRNLEFDKIDVQGAYSDEESTKANVTIYVNNGTKKYVTIPDVRWEVVSGEEDILSSSASLGEDNILSLSLAKLNLTKSKDNLVELNFIASYEGKSVSATKRITVKDPAVFSIKENEVYVLGEGEVSLEISKAAYHDENFPLDESDLTLRFDGSDLSEDWSVDDNVISIKLPPRMPGKYSLDITGDLNGIEESDTVWAIYPVTVSGRIIDANGKPIPGKLIFSNDDGVEMVNVKGDGTYSTNIEKGEYTIEMAGFRGLRRAVFYGVTLDEKNENLVSYDRFSNADIRGFKVAGAVSISFALGFRSATLQIEYDDTAYSGLNEQKLNVLQCSNWNFGQRSCNSEWESLSNYEIYSMGPGGHITIQTERLPAIVIGEKDTLNIKTNFNPERGEYYLDEELEVQGTVTNSKEEGIGNIKVYYKLDTWDERKEDETNEDGIFSFPLTAPSKAGEYELEVFTEDSVFKNKRQKQTFRVIEKKEITLLLPADTKLEAGIKKTLDIGIHNSGQAVLKDLEVKITGLNEFENYQPNKIEELKPGEKKWIKLEVVTQKKESVRRIEVSVDSSEVSKKDTFLVLAEVGEGAAGADTPEGSKDEENLEFPSIGLPSFTGLVGAIPSFTSIFTSINVLSIALSVAIIVVFVKVSRRGERKVNRYVVNLTKSLQKEIRKHRSEERQTPDSRPASAS